MNQLLRLPSIAAIVVLPLFGCSAWGADTVAATSSPPSQSVVEAVSTGGVQVAASARPFDDQRDPFWPPYVRPATAPEKAGSEIPKPPGEMEWRLVEKMLRETVKGVSRVPDKRGKTTLLALVNGKFVAVGDIVVLPANGKTYRWTVGSISMVGGPVFERVIPAPAPKK